MAPMKDALHLCMAMVLSELPAKAHILCIGAGTGAELIDLAKAFPQWRFTAVEPAAPMLDICRQTAQKHDFASRCNFHQGYLDTLPSCAPFDAAICLLVSHFFTQVEERRGFFSDIAARLRPGGTLVCADLASDVSSPAFKSLLEVWVRMLKYSDLPDTEVENFSRSIGKRVSVLPPREIAVLIAASGFEAPVLFCQTLLIHAWYASKQAPSGT